MSELIEPRHDGSNEHGAAGSRPADGSARPIGESVLDFISVVTAWRRFIVWFVLVCTVGTTVVALLLPKWYKSTASVFPADQADLLGGLEGVSSLVKSFSTTRKLSSLGGPTELDRYIAILESTTVLDSLIARFDLLHVYGVDGSSAPMEAARKELVGNSLVEAQDEGDLTITVFDRDPKRAADMANGYVQLLNDINSSLRVQNARGNRIFIEQRYQKNISDLAAAEDSLKAFQLKYGVIAMPEQTEASIKAGADVAGLLATKEIELGVMRRTLAPDHPSIRAAEIEIDEIRRKIGDLNRGSVQGSGEMSILVPFRQTPDLGLRYVRLYREVKIQDKILEFLTPLFEQAKVEEQRNTPSVLTLDHAIPAERKAKPRVSLLALLALVVSSMIALLIAFTMTGVVQLQRIDPDRFGILSSAIRSDWFGLKRVPWKQDRPG